MRVTLRRHAPTAGNLLSNYIGRTDEPLSSEGIRLAERVGADKTVQSVYTSALARTRQTAGILYPEAAVLVRDGLNEMDFGCFEGKNWRELDGDERYVAWLESNCEAPCPGGEGKAGFTARCREAFRAIVEEAESGSLHFVVHGGVIMAVMSGFVQPDRGYFAWKTGFCEGFVIERETGESFRLIESILLPKAEGGV